MTKYLTSAKYDPAGAGGDEITPECESLWQAARLGRVAARGCPWGSWLSLLFFSGRNSALAFWSGATLLRAWVAGKVEGHCGCLFPIRSQPFVLTDPRCLWCGVQGTGLGDRQMRAGVL